MDPITIGAFLASAGSSLAGGLLESSAAKTQAAYDRIGLTYQKTAMKTSNKAVGVQAKAAREAAGIEWKSGLTDFDAAMLEAEGVTLATAADYFNLLTDSENTARDFEANAEAGIFNAVVATQVAKNAMRVAQAEARDYRLRGHAAIETQAALQAGSGFMTTGSPMLVQDVLFGEIELVAAPLEHAGEVEAFRLGNEGKLLFHGAMIDKTNAKMAREMGKINAGYLKEAGKIRMDAAFLNGDRSFYTLEASQLNARTAETVAGFQKIANKTGFQSAKLQVAAGSSAAKTQGAASVVSGVGSAFNTIATSGMFG